ncbi:MAG: hypothetical protein AAF502_24605 [Bacteroidota bacterium]
MIKGILIVLTLDFQLEREGYNDPAPSNISDGARSNPKLKLLNFFVCTIDGSSQKGGIDQVCQTIGFGRVRQPVG